MQPSFLVVDLVRKKVYFQEFIFGGLFLQMFLGELELITIFGYSCRMTAKVKVRTCVLQNWLGNV